MDERLARAQRPGVGLCWERDETQRGGGGARRGDEMETYRGRGKREENKRKGEGGGQEYYIVR